MNYEDGEEDYSGLSGYEAQSKQKQKKILIISGVVVLALVVIIASFIGGYLVAFYIHNDSDCTNDDNSNTSPTATPTPTTSPSPSPSQSNTNAENSDVNIQYYQTVEKHAFTVDDLVRCDKISEPIPSPDGTRVVYTRYVHNPNTNQTSTTIWIQNLTPDLNKTQLTPFGWGISEFNPCWSLDSSVLLFASNRDPNNIYFPGDSTQVWQVSTNVTETGGNNIPTPLTSYPMDVNDLLCSNTLNYLAVGMNIIPGLSLQQTAERIQQAQSGSLRAYTYDKLFIRHWGNWFDGQRSHPFIQPISFSNSSFSLSSSLPYDVLNGTDADAPTKPYGGIEEWSFAPDDSEFAFTRRYDEASSVAWTTNLDVFTVQIQNSNNVITLSTPLSITLANTAADTQPAYSPDGNYIAYMAQSVPGYESDRYTLMLYDRASQNITNLSEDVDSSIDSLIWKQDSSGLFITTGVNATESIYFFDLSGNYNVILNEHWASSVSVLNEDQLIFLYNSMTTPNLVVTADIYSLNNITLIVDFNENQKNATWVSEPIRFSFVGVKPQQKCKTLTKQSP